MSIRLTERAAAAAKDIAAKEDKVQCSESGDVNETGEPASVMGCEATTEYRPSLGLGNGYPAHNQDSRLAEVPRHRSSCPTLNTLKVRMF